MLTCNMNSDVNTDTDKCRYYTITTIDTTSEGDIETINKTDIDT